MSVPTTSSTPASASCASVGHPRRDGKRVARLRRAPVDRLAGLAMDADALRHRHRRARPTGGHTAGQLVVEPPRAVGADHRRVLEAVDAGLRRQPHPDDAVRVGGDVPTASMRLVHSRLEDLARIGGLGRRRGGGHVAARRHHLDAVGAFVVEEAAHGRANAFDAVGFAAPPPAVAAGARDRPAADERPRAQDEAAIDGIADPEPGRAARAAVEDGRDARRAGIVQPRRRQARPARRRRAPASRRACCRCDRGMTRWTCASMRPGSAVPSGKSLVRACSGRATRSFGPTSTIRPSSTSSAQSRARGAVTVDQMADGDAQRLHGRKCMGAGTGRRRRCLRGCRVEDGSAGRWPARRHPAGRSP